MCRDVFAVECCDAETDAAAWAKPFCTSSQSSFPMGSTSPGLSMPPLDAILLSPTPAPKLSFDSPATMASDKISPSLVVEATQDSIAPILPHLELNPCTPLAVPMAAAVAPVRGPQSDDGASASRASASACAKSVNDVLKPKSVGVPLLCRGGAGGSKRG